MCLLAGKLIRKNQSINHRFIVSDQPVNNSKQPACKLIMIFLNVGKILHEMAFHNEMLKRRSSIPHAFPGIITTRFLNRPLYNHIIVATPVEELQPCIKSGFAIKRSMRFINGKTKITGMIQVLDLNQHCMKSCQTITHVREQRCLQSDHFLSDKWDVIDNDHNGKFDHLPVPGNDLD